MLAFPLWVNSGRSDLTIPMAAFGRIADFKFRNVEVLGSTPSTGAIFSFGLSCGLLPRMGSDPF